jgi:hypothetical protein
LAQVGELGTSEEAFATAQRKAEALMPFDLYRTAMEAISLSRDEAGDRRGAQSLLRDAAEAIAAFAISDAQRTRQLARLAPAQARLADLEGLAKTRALVKRLAPAPTAQSEFVVAELNALGLDPEAAVAFADPPDIAARPRQATHLLWAAARTQAQNGRLDAALATIRTIQDPTTRVHGLLNVVRIATGLPVVPEIGDPDSVDLAFP